ncbi:ATP-dependent RNA helicase drs1-like [Lycium ferocissimum]|uniref:ATP-dependent RNA helicase drs1-like n=1 Tax=Lycium ferocissimum TaxID=112874 RepID=UPI002815360A|nr:ATP-dependent RNA helicase drs1-like [Lycium ferocissimum]
MRIRKRNLKEGKDADYHVQQEMAESTVQSSNTIDLTIKSLHKNKKESCKEMIQNGRPEESNESKKEKEQEGSFQEQEALLEKRQAEEDINDEFELNIIISNDNLLDNTNSTMKDNNDDNGLNLPTRDEKGQSYYRLKQGIPRSAKFRSIINIYKCTNRLSSPEDEYNWSPPGTLENHKYDVHNKGKSGKD